MDQVHQVSAWRSRRQGTGQGHSRDPSAVLRVGCASRGTLQGWGEQRDLPEALRGRTDPDFCLAMWLTGAFIPSARAAISRDPFYEMLAARKKKVSSTKRH